jgi:DNA polymerase III alpha subunit (gram-positive type)
MAAPVPTKAICIDWETSGSTWGGDSSILHQGISFGLVVFDTRTFDPIDMIYHEIKFDSSKYKWSNEAQAVHGISREYLEQNGISQEDAAVAMVEILLKHFGPDPTIMFLGHNVGFDVLFTKQLLEPFELMFKTHNVLLDTACTALITMGIHKSDLVFEALGLEERQMHNALEDCLMTIEACKRIRMIFEAGLNG